MTTHKETLTKWYNPIEFKQFDSKQLYRLTINQELSLLISYLTIIGIKLNNKWYITDEKFSQTTTRQTSYYVNLLNKSKVNYEIVSYDKLNQLVKENY